MLTADLVAVPPALVMGPVEARISAHFTARLAQARKTALDALDGERYPRLLDELGALLANPPLTPSAERKAGKALAKPVRRAARRLRACPGRRARCRRPRHGDPPGAQSRQTGTVRRGSSSAALGSTARLQAAQAKELQQVLGDHHDSVVARTVLLELAHQAREAGEDTFTYGVMHQRQACQAAKIEQALPRLTAAI